MKTEDFPRVSDIVGRFEDTSYYDDFSRERGTEVHRAIKAICMGLWTPTLKLHQGYVDSFQGWFDEMVQEVILVEKPFVSTNFGFRGTLDFLGRIKSRGLSIVDWKTSASASKIMKKLWKLRISGGYRILAEENGYQPIEACFALQLNADGKPATVMAEGNLIDQTYFLSALNVNRYLAD